MTFILNLGSLYVKFEKLEVEYSKETLGVGPIPGQHDFTADPIFLSLRLIHQLIFFGHLLCFQLLSYEFQKFERYLITFQMGFFSHSMHLSTYSFF